MSGKTCFFIGNRDSAYSIKKQLEEAVEKHITEYGVTTFIVGRYGMFDNFVAGVLQEAKKRHTNIKLYLLEPYALSRKYKTKKPRDFDGIIYPEDFEAVPMRFAIVQANRYMIKNSDYLISYCCGVGNSRKFTEYAKRREKQGLIKVTLL